MKTRITIGAMTILASLSFAAGPRYSDWSEPVNLGPVINTGYNDQHPALSKDGLSLYISSDRPGGFGATDLWVSQRARVDDPWGEPQELGPAWRSFNSSPRQRVGARRSNCSIRFRCASKASA